MPSEFEKWLASKHDALSKVAVSEDHEMIGELMRICFEAGQKAGLAQAAEEELNRAPYPSCAVSDAFYDD